MTVYSPPPSHGFSTTSSTPPSGARLMPGSSRLEDDDAAAGEAIPLRSLNARRDSGIPATTDAEKGIAYGDHDDEADEDEEGDGDEEEKRFLGRPSQGSSTTLQDYELYTPDEEAAVVKKLDRKMVLFMGLLYMLSFLDRSNIGNARIAGLTDDLKLSSAQYEWLLTGFYITYIAFEWLTLMYRVFPPHVYISICVFSWGLLASLQSTVPSFFPLLLLRALLGIGEAAFGPGVPFYLSFFFRRDELAFRTGLFISAAPLSTSFASSLAWLITKLGEGGPIAPWRLLFLIEGFPSLFVAVWAWRLIPDGPGSARWLSEREREVAVLRLRKEREVVDGEDEEKMLMDEERTGRSGGVGKKQKGLNVKEIWQTLKDPKCYLTALMFFSCNVAFSSLPVFLPTIIQEMGHSALTSQALSAPPYLLSFLVVLLTARLSDRHANRSPFLALHALLAFSGYALIALAGYHRLPAFWRYVGVYPATIGFFSGVTLIITWTINNQDSDTKKGTGMAVLNVVGQCGPLLGTRLYPDGDKPYYVRGMVVCAAFMAVVGILALVLRFVLARENERRLRAWQEEERAAVDGEDAGVPLVGGGRKKARSGPFMYIL